VEVLAERLARYPVTKIFSSPVLRAVQSAKLVAQYLDIDYEVVEALREYDVGTFEGTRDLANWDIYERVVTGWLLEGQSTLRTGGRESLEEIQDRFGSFVFRLPAMFPTPSDELPHPSGVRFKNHVGA
jgi:broad specificity phosphatase PhoE